MPEWTSDELTRIEAADELRMAPRRRDGSLRNPVTIWVVRHRDRLFVRSVNGRGAAWFRAALATRSGRIQSGGVEKDVDLVEPDEDIADQLDAAYRAKYRRYAAGIVNSVLSRAARSAVFELVPRPPGG
jgi:hypothetical protein